MTNNPAGCGCKVIIKDELQPVYRIQCVGYPERWIEYCPLHASASQMLEALKKIAENDYPRPDDICRTICPEIAEEAINAAQRKP